MKILLENKGLRLLINSYGACIEEFSYKKNPIFFPKLITKVKDKLATRGGMVPVLGDFKKDEAFSSNIKSSWDVLKEDNDSLALSLKVPNKEGFILNFIEYRIEESSLRARLMIENLSKEDIFINPSFKSFYYLGGDFKLKDTDFKNLDQAKIVKKDYINLLTKYNDIEIYNEGLEEFAVWTDDYGDYLCLGSILNSSKDKSILKIGETFRAEVRIKIK